MNLLWQVKPAGHEHCGRTQRTSHQVDGASLWGCCPESIVPIPDNHTAPRRRTPDTSPHSPRGHAVPQRAGCTSAPARRSRAPPDVPSSCPSSHERAPRCAWRQRRAASVPLGSDHLGFGCEPSERTAPPAHCVPCSSMAHMAITVGLELGFKVNSGSAKWNAVSVPVRKSSRQLR